MLGERFPAVSEPNHLKLRQLLGYRRLETGERLGLTVVHTGLMLTYEIRKRSARENTAVHIFPKDKGLQQKFTLINQINMAGLDSDHKYSLKCGVNSFVATYIAGVLHPLDLVKTRFQSHDGKGEAENLVPKYKGILNALRTIYNKEGFRGLFKGFHVSMLTQASVTAMFFWMYELRKIKHMKQGNEEMLSVTLASSEASIFGTLVTQPLWVIKTRMLLNTKPNLRDIQNFLFSVKQIYRQDRLRGFANGLNISLILSFSGVLQMFTYEGAKKIYDSMKIPQSILSQRNFFCGALSKFIAVIITYPFTTVRTRAQQNQYIKDDQTKKYRGSMQIVKQTYKGQGLSGFYKGFHINIIRGILQRGIYFYFYELFKTLIFEEGGTCKLEEDV